MKYTVVWKPAAEQELASIWTNATDRQAVTAAAHRIDELLQRDPEQAGESRPSGIRILIVPPLAVRFKVDTQDRMVSVARVWRFKKRGPSP
jgi:plasmid stabilization system protein ParE